MSSLYDPDAVKKLFDEMSRDVRLGQFDRIVRICLALARKQCVRAIAGARGGQRNDSIPHGGNAVDLMTGMGEMIPDLARLLGPHGHILGIDFSSAMCRKARERRFDCDVQVVESDVLTFSFLSEHTDAVVCSFGLKTLSSKQIRGRGASRGFYASPRRGLLVRGNIRPQVSTASLALHVLSKTCGSPHRQAVHGQSVRTTASLASTPKRFRTARRH